MKLKSRRRYRIIDYLGSGGTVTAHLAVCTAPIELIGRLVAIKFFRKYSKPERRKKFLEAFSFLSECSHPAIVKVYDLDSYYTRPLVIEEYLPMTLQDVIRRKQATMVEKACYATQLLSSLVFLEKEGVVHRDIQPKNIFIKGRSCILGDFGMMKSIKLDIEVDIDDIGLVEDPIPEEIHDRIYLDDIEQSSTEVTGHYWSPDKVLDFWGKERITPKSDVYQMGLVLAHLFTGYNRQPKLPRDSENNPILNQALEGAMGPDNVGSIPSLLSGGIANLIKQMLVKKPSIRKNASALIKSWMSVLEDITRAAKVIEEKAFRLR